MIKLILFINGKITTNEINNYYSEFDLLAKNTSEQSVFQARENLNFDVFLYLNNETSGTF